MNTAAKKIKNQGGRLRLGRKRDALQTKLTNVLLHLGKGRKHEVFQTSNEEYKNSSWNNEHCVNTNQSKREQRKPHYTPSILRKELRRRIRRPREPSESEEVMISKMNVEKTEKPKKVIDHQTEENLSL